MRIQYISDDVKPGAHGGELNDQELLRVLEKELDTEIVFNRSSASELKNIEYYKDNKNDKFLLNSFFYIPHRDYLVDNLDYIVYEHSHKYDKYSGDPSTYRNNKVPEIGFKDIYVKAKAVLCQSKLHADTLKKNIPEANVINLSGNVWSADALECMDKFREIPKNDKVFIYNHKHYFKNTQYNVKFCERHGIEYDLIEAKPYIEFLESMAQYKAFVYFPGWMETLNRMAVECRMMGVGVVTDALLGAASEEWFNLEGEQLTAVMRRRRHEIANTVLQVFE
jgi:hypothetical protein